MEDCREVVIGYTTHRFPADIKYFLVTFVDLLGVLRSKLVPTSAIKQMLEKGAGFAGYAVHFDMTTADADLMAFPDMSTLIQLPWKKEVAWVASDLYINGKLFKQAPRQVLKDQVAKVAKAPKACDGGYYMKTGVECEFFLLSRNSSSGSKPEAADAFEIAPKPCYRQGALMRSFDVISKLLEYMESLGWEPYQADHEDGQSQFEINWKYDDCLRTADKHVFFKFMVKSVAEQHGFQATFMPKPFRHQTGNGCHTHISVWDHNNSTHDETCSTNLFHDPEKELGMSKLSYHFLGGLLGNAKVLCGIYNPTVNSFKRIDGQTTLSGSSWAPNIISYAGNNRTHLVRIPDEGRFELRVPDGAVNPYLLQAAILASGLDGIENQLDPGPRRDWDGFEPHPDKESLDRLPTNFLDALRELSSSNFAKQSFGEEFVKSYVKVQMQQWKSYAAHISQWELENTLDC
ncbi:glutamine synthetase [Marchantia polymorpha subsp. ruderalis]|uniref:Glutamine synthetase n=2 Tax=Marchantia polymorpha TaxID=3197 RepID=A0AAF6B240_MARPO|nr:hypothetical protein MARPO_0140s0025 [Marchantia polymorpha]BBN06074.1 hypothetical protein Mp_3g18160 [Marchantia polymorpha subsp. ruderalis]|eukprot:PTQ29493.1 hypothetical protein MARPO_0140s0025 [Marchantia polymorpha]